MTLTDIIGVGIGALLYALLGLHVGYDVAVHNRGMLPAQRLSPWLRGAFWLPFYLLGLAQLAWDCAQPRR